MMAELEKLIILELLEYREQLREEYPHLFRNIEDEV